MKMLQFGGRGAVSLPCDGDKKIVYVVDREKFPTFQTLIAGGYSDVVVALGINHCRRAGEWLDAAGRMVAIMRSVRRVLPGVRLYCMLPPPSLDEDVAARANLFGLRVGALLRGCRADVAVIEPDSRLYTPEGLLNPLYARASELRGSVTGDRRLHLNVGGVKLMVASLMSSMSVRSAIPM